MNGNTFHSKIEETDEVDFSSQNLTFNLLVKKKNAFGTLIYEKIRDSFYSVGDHQISGTVNIESNITKTGQKFSVGKSFQIIEKPEWL